jgi:trk system potassium uptake protein TrkA
MFVLIAGGGRTGAELAAHLIRERHTVRRIEVRRDVLVHLHRELPTEVILEGNPTDPGLLEAADAAHADVVAACLSSDPENLALCFLAREHFKVPRTIACISNPRNAWLFNETFHVDVALNQADILANLIEQEMSVGDMMTLLKLRRGSYSVVSERIPQGARAVGVALKDLPLPKNSVIAAILRQGDVVIPRGDVVFLPQDEVLAVVDERGAEELARLFGRPDEGFERPAP